MIAARSARDDFPRLLASEEWRLLDSDTDPVLDALVRSTASLLDCPMALVSLADSDRQFFSAQVGIDGAQTQGCRAFCDQTLAGRQLFEVPDATLDHRFARNPMVTAAPHLRFYAGAPLMVEDRVIGTLCVIDSVPRVLDAAQRALLQDQALAVEQWIESWRLHHQLRETHGFLAKIARHAPGVFYQFRLAGDGSSHFPYASEGIGAIYELTAAAVRQDAGAVFERLHPEDIADVRAAIEHSARTLMPWSQQYRVVLPERGLRWLEGHATPERIDDGSVLWSGFIQDITDRQTAELVIREHFASERASRAKTELLARVSHELKTPLNAILGFTQLMRHEVGLPQRTQRHAHLVHQAGQQLLELINDLLDLTQLESGLRNFQIQPVAVFELVRTNLAMIEPLAAARSIQVLPVRGDRNLRVSADARALSQVLRNLLSNAVKYNRDGGGLAVEMRRAGAEVMIAVDDDGPGLTPAQRLSLFQPFNRLGAENSAIPGSGLGLVISKQLVEAMHGRLEVHGRAAGGSRFEVWLPVDALDAMPDGTGSGP